MANSYGLNSDELLADLLRKLGLPDPRRREGYAGRAADPRIVAGMRARAAAERQAAAEADAAAGPADPINAARHRNDSLKAGIIRALTTTTNQEN